MSVSHTIPTDSVIFHLCRWPEWQHAMQKGVYVGSEAARADGFLHFSRMQDVEQSARLHMRNINDLHVMVVDTIGMGSKIRWEASDSRDGALFPHVYESVPMTAIIATLPVPLGAQGAYIFPDLSLF